MDGERARVPAAAGPASLAAVVVNYNGGSFVVEAVESLLAQDLPGLEVVVVDNDSKDGSDGVLERTFGDRIRVLRAGGNRGFGGGNNLALRATKTPYVLLLNSDAVAAPDCARQMLAEVEADSTVGMVAAKMLDYERRQILDNTGHLLYPDGLNRGRGRLDVDAGQYDRIGTALFPSGAGALYRRAMLDEIGLFDEAFFLYGDDADLGLRGRLAGWGCALAPRAIIYHRYSQSVGAYSTLKAFYVERNRLLVLLKLFPFRSVLLSPAFTAARFALQAWGALRGRGAAARLARERSMLHLVAVVLRAYASALFVLPRTVRARYRFRRVRRLDTAGFKRLLAEFRLTAREVALKD